DDQERPVVRRPDAVLDGAPLLRVELGEISGHRRANHLHIGAPANHVSRFVPTFSAILEPTIRRPRPIQRIGEWTMADHRALGRRGGPFGPIPPAVWLTTAMMVTSRAAQRPRQAASFAAAAPSASAYDLANLFQPR